MKRRRAFALLAGLALLSPWLAMAAPACGPGAPGQHCPMAEMADDGPPCHGSAIQGDDCCVSAAGVEPADGVPIVSATVLEAGQAEPAVRQEPARGIWASASCAPPSTPLYRLFRALLI